MYKILITFMACSLLLSQSNIPIKDLERLIKSSGLSEAQINDLINNQNLQTINSDLPMIPSRPKNIYPSQDTKNEVENILKTNLSQNNEMLDVIENSVASKIDNITPENNIDKIGGDENNIDKIDYVSEYFGYSTFFNNPEVFQKSTDFGIPPSYIIGPGDEIILMLWGDTEDVSEYIVSRDGYIFIPILVVSL